MLVYRPFKERVLDPTAHHLQSITSDSSCSLNVFPPDRLLADSEIEDTGSAQPLLSRHMDLRYRKAQWNTPSPAPLVEKRFQWS